MLLTQYCQRVYALMIYKQESQWNKLSQCEIHMPLPCFDQVYNAGWMCYWTESNSNYIDFQVQDIYTISRSFNWFTFDWAGNICQLYDLSTPSRKFLCVKFCRPESLYFLCLWTGGGGGKEIIENTFLEWSDSGEESRKIFCVQAFLTQAYYRTSYVRQPG